MKIMLCCSDGMSTSLLVEKMKVAAQEKGIEAEIWADCLASIPSYVEKTPDIIMVGPQIKFKLKSIQETFANTTCKVVAIDMRDYGAMRGENVLISALKELGIE